jgi:hypothetical protein
MVVIIFVRSPDGIGPDAEEADHQRTATEGGGPSADAF